MKKTERNKSHGNLITFFCTLKMNIYIYRNKLTFPILFLLYIIIIIIYYYNNPINYPKITRTGQTRRR